MKLLEQMGVAVPTIIAATMVLTSAIGGIFKIEKDWINHLIFWIVVVATAIGFVCVWSISLWFW